MRTFLVAIVAPSEGDVVAFLAGEMPGIDGVDSAIDAWWIAEDDRHDGSDNDSAIFVPRGGQADFSELVNQHCEAQQDRWDEEGYPYADTDVSGVWYPPPSVRWQRIKEAIARLPR